MKYLIFNTKQEAEAAELAISQQMGFPKVGYNAQTGQPQPSATGTQRWAIPQETLDHRWVFPSPDGQGVDYDPSWFPKPKSLV